jgi:general secretion pathway protein D
MRERRITVRLRDVPLRLAFDALAQATGLKFIPDRDVRSDLRTTLFVTEARVTEVLEALMQSNQLAMRAFDDRTLLIYPDTPAKQRAYGELQARTFVLRHADAAAMATLLKTLLKSASVLSDARSNTLVVRDTPDALQVAEQLIAANDRPDGDVMIEVQVIEVSRQRLSQLGVTWPTTLGLASPDNAATLGALRALGSNAWLFTPLALGLNLQLQDIDATLIANPSVRARHKEKARLLIGDKVPVMSTQLAQRGAGNGADVGTSTPAEPAGSADLGNAGGGAQTLLSGSVNYIEVGLRLEVEPQVHGDGDIGLALMLELSQISKTLNAASGVVYQIGTRQAQTSMRLHDGQTQWLGGLINRQERLATGGLPGLAQMPVLGRLFGVDRQDRSETELLLAITPRLVRAAGAMPAGTALLDSGNDSRVRAVNPQVLAPLGDERSRPLTEIDLTGRSVNLPGVNGMPATSRALPPALPDGVDARASDMPGVPIVVPRQVPGATRRSPDGAGTAPADAAGR